MDRRQFIQTVGAASVLAVHPPSQRHPPKPAACMGWQDADTELLESARQRHRANVSEEEDFRHTGADLYHVGGQARIHDLPFDEARTQPWKLGWVDADINLGAMLHEN